MKTHLKLQSLTTERGFTLLILLVLSLLIAIPAIMIQRSSTSLLDLYSTVLHGRRLENLGVQRLISSPSTSTTGDLRCDTATLHRGKLGHLAKICRGKRDSLAILRHSSGLAVMSPTYRPWINLDRIFQSGMRCPTGPIAARSTADLFARSVLTCVLPTQITGDAVMIGNAIAYADISLGNSSAVSQPQLLAVTGELVIPGTLTLHHDTVIIAGGVIALENIAVISTAPIRLSLFSATATIEVNNLSPMIHLESFSVYPAQIPPQSAISSTQLLEPYLLSELTFNLS